MRFVSCLVASFVIATAAIAATPKKPPSTSGDTALAEKIIKSRLVDPYSVHFEMLSSVVGKDKTGNTVRLTCGTYNAKNKLGGYVGAKHFVYVPLEKAVFTAGGRFGEDGNDVSLDDLAEKMPVDSAGLSASLDQIKALEDDTKFWLLQCSK
jgi:hypothetical protein